eukprot:GHVU01041354.1.p1 GENE.GHVU01041354.1~~GHVU01041354.1.p1  ORF type:complete len:265 (-),score=51.18 GHVU01041354.1:1266-2060(-)
MVRRLVKKCVRCSLFTDEVSTLWLLAFVHNAMQKYGSGATMMLPSNWTRSKMSTILEQQSEGEEGEEGILNAIAAPPPPVVVVRDSFDVALDASLLSSRHRRSVGGGASGAEGAATGPTRKRRRASEAQQDDAHPPADTHSTPSPAGNGEDEDLCLWEIHLLRRHVNHHIANLAAVIDDSQLMQSTIRSLDSKSWEGAAKDELQLLRHSLKLRKSSPVPLYFQPGKPDQQQSRGDVSSAPEDLWESVLSLKKSAVHSRSQAACS